MNILVTGGCGFIASFVVEHLLKTTDCNIILISKSESYYAKLRMADIGAEGNARVAIFRVDMSGGVPPIPDVDYILHMGAESHVDSSIKEPEAFIRSNILGTYKMLEYARTLPDLKKFLYFSTDEVYGPAKAGEVFTEWSRYNSCNPYAATKAAAEELCLAWENTYKVPCVITHSMNVFGERQHPEKFVPLVIKKILADEVITIHVDACGNPVVRSFVYGEDVADATIRVLFDGQPHQKYGIKGRLEIPISELAEKIAGYLGKEAKMEFKYPAITRPGVDTRYAVGGTNMKDLGWEASRNVLGHLQATVQWYSNHRAEWYV